MAWKKKMLDLRGAGVTREHRPPIRGDLARAKGTTDAVTEPSRKANLRHGPRSVGVVGFLGVQNREKLIEVSITLAWVAFQTMRRSFSQLIGKNS